jgi:hypothetical protein
MPTSAQSMNGQPVAPRYAWFSLALIGVMCVYSFLNYYHQNPWTTFYQEWGTAALGLAAATLLLGGRYWRQSEIPRIVLLPIGMMLLVVLQYLLGMLPYFGQMLMFALYLMWAALLIMLGARLRELLGLPAVATVLAVFLLTGAELSAFIGIHQHYQWNTYFTQYIIVKMSAAVVGNVSQANHYADYETLGLISLGLLYARRLLPGWAAALLALPILFVLPLTGSRELWAYLSWPAVLAWLWQRKQPDRRPLLTFGVLALAGFALMHVVVALPWLQPASGGTTTTVGRMFGADVHSGAIHLRLLPDALRIFLHHPLLGAGFGEYAWQHYLMTASEGTAGIPGLYNNAHDLVLQVAAEGGIVGLVVLFGTLLPWLRQAFRAERTVYHWWGYGLLGVLGIHSMLEYPLWYTYFLGIAAILLGMLDVTRFRLELGFVGRVFMVLAMLLGALSLQQLFSGYRVLENLSYLRVEGGDVAGYYARLRSGIAQLHGQLLLQPYTDLLTSPMIEVDEKNLSYKLALNTRLERYVPVAQVVYRQALLLAQDGQIEAAEAEMERAIWAYPRDYGAAESLLRELAARDPTRFNALLKFTVQKHEEYLSAVHP